MCASMVYPNVGLNRDLHLTGFGIRSRERDHGSKQSECQQLPECRFPTFDARPAARRKRRYSKAIAAARIAIMKMVYRAFISPPFVDR